METCPTIEELERFVELGETTEWIRDHAKECSSCFRKIDDIRRHNDLLKEMFALGVVSGEDELAADADPLLGATIGHYKIKRIIASGGMGVVYEAVQEQPRRTVALKVMRAGIASRSALRRFEYEAQLLARLRHTGIAQVYEAGTHDDGRARVPYFAMEYIPNARSLTDYAAWKHLGIRDRLALFSLVCDAIQHGHQRGIIHRDLKPGNILVDSAGHPKVIDFGVARATDSDMAVTTMQTDVGQLIGTLQYMSPEQCEADPHDLDVRSDVYALGVTLYELVCGGLPYQVRAGTVVESARIICEQSPVRPSSIDKTLRGDVETIILKALEKDRDRRYQSAQALADDIRRYLEHEPIQARPATTLYRVKRFVRRHQPLVIATLVVLLALILGLVGTSAGMIRAQRAEADANAARHQVEEELSRARTAKDMALEIPKLAAASGQSAEAMTVREALDQWTSQIPTRFVESPANRALALGVAGTAYLEIGEFDIARPLLEESLAIRRSELGDRHPDVANAMSNLGAFFRRTGDLDRAEEHFRNSLEIYVNVYGEQNEFVADQLNNLAVVLANQGAQNPDKYRQAIPYYLRAKEVYSRLGQAEGEVRILNNLGGVYVRLGELQEAERMLRQSYDRRIRLYGRTHRFVAATCMNLGELYVNMDKPALAEKYFAEALDIRRELLGDEHTDTQRARTRLAEVKSGQNSPP